MEAFTDTLPIVCNGFKGKVQRWLLPDYQINELLSEILRRVKLVHVSIILRNDFV